MKFTASQFVATKWEPADAKAKFANQFVKFVESDFASSKFPKWFYTRLSMTFGHIAHYDQGGFFETFFTSPQDKKEFLSQTLQGGGYGDPEYTYSDVEKALKMWLKTSPVLGKYHLE